eukprot:1547405-Alexandrium_andersonii.AAC.1
MALCTCPSFRQASTWGGQATALACPTAAVKAEARAAANTVDRIRKGVLVPPGVEIPTWYLCMSRVRALGNSTICTRSMPSHTHDVAMLSNTFVPCVSAWVMPQYGRHSQFTCV